MIYSGKIQQKADKHMKSKEEKIQEKSEYYLYSPSKIALNTFFYPIGVGHFYYEKGYHLNRSSYDSFLFIYIKEGSMQVSQKSNKGVAAAGTFVLLDCYAQHEYTAMEDCETIWLHFDGISARPFFEYITARLSMNFTLDNPGPVILKLERIFSLFSSGVSIQEARVSKYINDILTELILDVQKISSEKESGTRIEEIITYLSQHSKEDMTLDELANRAGLSKYYFIRLFKKETGFTPHDYIVNMRIDTAKYLLSNTNMTVKEVCFSSGFSNESVFSATFKKKVGLAPSGYKFMEEE